MKRFLLILILFGAFNAFCQKNSYSIEAGINYPMIGEVSHKATITAIPVPSSPGNTSYTTNLGTVREVFEGNIGFFVSGKINRTIHKRFFLTSGLSFDYRRFNRSVIIDRSEEQVIIQGGVITLNPDPGQPYGVIHGSLYIRDANGNLILNPDGRPTAFQSESSNRRGDTEVFQLEAPLLAGTHFLKEKLTVQLGFNVGYILTASEYKQTYSYSMSRPTITTAKEESSSDFNRFSVGINFTTTYRIYKKIGIQISALRNLTPIYQGEARQAGSAYLNSFSAGINYFISNPLNYQ